MSSRFCFQGISHYRSVFVVADILESDYFMSKGSYMAGMTKGFHSQCSAYDAECVSPYASETLWSQMLSFVHTIAIHNGLQYSLACESLRYAFNRKQLPPHYAAVAVRSKDAEIWLSQLQLASKISTFVVEHQEDGSMVHVRFSRYSNVRLVVWQIPAAVVLKTKTLTNDTKHVDVMVAAEGVHNDYLLHICETCDQCQATPKVAAFYNSSTMNYNTGTCLDISNRMGFRLFSCHNLV